MDCNFAIAKPASGHYEKFFQLAGPLLVAPVPHPDHICIFFVRQGPEVCCVGTLVKCPNSFHTKTLSVDAPNCLSKGQHAVKPSERHSQNRTSWPSRLSSYARPRRK